MTIKRGVLIAAGVPLLFSLILSAMLSYKFWQNYRADEEVKDIVELTAVAFHLVHELQKERGMSAGFVGSSGSKFRQALRKQREETDKRLEGFISFVDRARFPASLRKRIMDIKERLNEIENTRQLVDNLSIDKVEVVKFYTGINRSLIDLIGNAVHGAQNTHIALRLVAIKDSL
jgi:methyl-accepting chemotaxis protein